MKNNHIFMEIQDSCIVVKILKNLDSTLASEVEESFSSLVKHVDRTVQLDLSESEYLDSSGIGAIAFLYKRLKQLDFDLELTGLNQQALTLVQSLNINEVIPSSADKSQASRVPGNTK